MKIEVLVNIKMCLVAFIIAIAMMLQSNISHISTSTLSFSLSDSPTQRYSFPFSTQINYIFWNLECCTFVLICVHKIYIYIYFFLKYYTLSFFFLLYYLLLLLIITTLIHFSFSGLFTLHIQMMIHK